ncbi:alpha,alpha-trehalase nth1 [Didymella sp. IMI 355093]|nr:alpha,alpha-trehalase nth1 [Didymella sp. IMI 355093]
MEQHLAALDTPLPDSPVDNSDASAGNAEDLPAPTPSAQNQTAASASSSDQVVPDVTEPQGTIHKCNSELPASTTKDSETPKLTTIRAKAQYSRPRFLTLIACVSYLLFHLMGIHIGLRSIQGYTEPRLQYAKVQLDATYQALVDDVLLDVRFNNLYETALHRRNKETNYEDCLARGLHEASHVFGSLDFTSNPQIRNQTADWVQSNCDRLFYTPQVHSLKSSKLRVQTEMIRQAIEELLRRVRCRLAILQYKLQGGNPRLAAKPFLVRIPIKANNRPHVLPDMPYGFSLERQDQTRCRLVYSGPTTPDKTSKTLKDAVSDARKEVDKWSYTDKFERMYCVLNFIRRPLAVLQPLLIMCYLLVAMAAIDHPQSLLRLYFVERKARVWKGICHIIARFSNQERHAVGFFINTALYALLGFQLVHILPEFDRLLLPVGLGLCAYHSVLAGMFLDSPREGCPDESIHDIGRAAAELYRIAQGIEVPELAPQWRRASAPKKQVPAAAAKPASKIAARFISPLTPIAEDLQQERKVMHAEQGKPLHDVYSQYGNAIETDEEYNSDVERDSYVDLAGGVTPTDSEDGDLIIAEE